MNAGIMGLESLRDKLLLCKLFPLVLLVPLVRGWCSTSSWVPLAVVAMFARLRCANFKVVAMVVGGIDSDAYSQQCRSEIQTSSGSSVEVDQVPCRCSYLGDI